MASPVGQLDVHRLIRYGFSGFLVAVGTFTLFPELTSQFFAVGGGLPASLAFLTAGAASYVAYHRALDIPDKIVAWWHPIRNSDLLRSLCVHHRRDAYNEWRKHGRESDTAFGNLLHSEMHMLHLVPFIAFLTAALALLAIAVGAPSDQARLVRISIWAGMIGLVGLALAIMGDRQLLNRETREIERNKREAARLLLSRNFDRCPSCKAPIILAASSPL